MDNVTKKVVIITTKKYPISKDWENGKDMDPKRLELFTKKNGLQGLVALMDFDGVTEPRNVFLSKPCVKTKPFKNGAWLTCVVPCMKENEELNPQQKGQYLEYILELCSEGCETQEVYLVAHDKDFVNYVGVKGELVKEKHIPTQDCVRLKKLVRIGHAYMFQHDSNNDVGKEVIPYIDDLKEELFKRLLEIVDAEWDMRDFFVSVNKNPSSNYPVKNPVKK